MTKIVMTEERREIGGRGPALNTERKVTLSYAASEFFATEDCRQDP
jgi:hypothetical protein